ncbi:hypothetical protein DIPPA_34987 [Diplonema papillatum]|nr:hypothetical protein DIPPA_34987 [Diplonema papillatum]
MLPRYACTLTSPYVGAPPAGERDGSERRQAGGGAAAAPLVAAPGGGVIPAPRVPVVVASFGGPQTRPRNYARSPPAAARIHATGLHTPPNRFHGVPTRASAYPCLPLNRRYAAAPCADRRPGVPPAGSPLPVEPCAPLLADRPSTRYQPYAPTPLRPRSVVDAGTPVERALVLSVAFASPLALHHLLLVGRSLRARLRGALGVSALRALLDALQAEYGCSPFFICGAPDDPTRKLCTLTGAWDPDRRPYTDPPPSTLLLPFSGEAMSTLWNSVLPRATAVPPYSWGTINNADEARLFLSRAMMFHKDDMDDDLSPIQRTEARQLWGLLGTIVSSLTSSYKFHALYIEARWRELLTQVHLLMFEQVTSPASADAR